MKYEKRSRRHTSSWICVRAVVKESKLRQLRKQTNQIDPAVLEPLSDLVLRNIMSTSRDAGTNTCNVELGCRKTDVPDSSLDPLRERPQKEARDGVTMAGSLPGTVYIHTVWTVCIVSL